MKITTIFRRSRAAVCVAIAVIATCGFMADAQTIVTNKAPAPRPSIVFAPPSPSQYTALFSDNSLWPNAARRVDVISLASDWINNTATDDDLSRIIAFAKRYKKKINLSLHVVAKLQGDTCGGIEGYSWPGEMVLALNRLIQLGAMIDRFDMDEPIWFGHYYTGTGGCQIPVPELIDRMSTIINTVAALAPHATFVDVEPLIDTMQQPDWRQTLSTVWAGIARQTGQHIGYFEADVNWDNAQWRPFMVQMDRFLREKNMGLGIIYNGTLAQSGDAQWIASALANAEITEGLLGISPSFAVFASWTPFGQNNVPETSNTAQTWLINRYARDQPRISASFAGRDVRGRLITMRGEPIANATIEASVPGVNFNVPLPVWSFAGTVPANAATAVMGVRLNLECGCEGLNDVLVGQLRYQEILGGSVTQTFSFPPDHAIYQGVMVDGETVAGTRVTRFIAPVGTSFLTNSTFFPVTPGAAYSFSAPAGTMGGEGWYGNVIIIFVTADNQGIMRQTITPDAGKSLTWTVTTAADGSFLVPAFPRVGPGAKKVQIQYHGNDIYRGVSWVPPR